MTFAPRTGASILLATLALAAHAEAPKSRDEVKAELREAIRSGDVIAAGESGLKMNEREPQRYAAPVAATTSRAEVRAELAAAARAGTLIVAGDAAIARRDQSPQRYPAPALALARTRDEVKAETRAAVREGEMVAAGEADMRLSGAGGAGGAHRPARERAVYAQAADAPLSMASAAAR